MTTTSERAHTRDPAKRAMAAVRAILPHTAKVQTAHGDSSQTLIVNGEALRIRWAGEGWLRQVRSILEDSTPHPHVVVARRMSPGAREALSRADIGWVDEAGGAEIAVGSIVVSRTAEPAEPDEKPARWTPAVLAVAEALLCGTTPTVAATQETTGLSEGSCTRALRVLSDLGLLTADAKRGRESGRRIIDWHDFLDEYAAAATALPSKASLQVGITWRDVLAGLTEIGRKWDRAGLAWATTGGAASLVIAPFLTSVRTAKVFVDAHTVPELRVAVEQVELRPIEGGRLSLLPFPTVTTSRLAVEVEGIRVAPWPRVFADLRTEGVRGEEAAEHLRELNHGR